MNIFCTQNVKFYKNYVKVYIVKKTRKVNIPVSEQFSPIHAQILTRRVTIQRRAVAHAAVRNAPIVGGAGAEPPEGCGGSADSGSATNKRGRKLRSANHRLRNVWIITSGLARSTGSVVNGYVCAAVELFLFSTSFANLAVRSNSKTIA